MSGIIGGAANQAAQIPTSAGATRVLVDLSRKAQDAARVTAALPAVAPGGGHGINIVDTVALDPSDAVALSFVGDQSAAHGLLRTADPEAWFLPQDGLHIVAGNVAQGHDTALVLFTSDTALCLPGEFSDDAGTGATIHLIAGPKGARVTAVATDPRVTGSPISYQGGFVVWSLATTGTP